MITVINNQPIRLRNINEIDESCECAGQLYSQLINRNDETQFQIKSSSLITNGNFDSDLDGWNVFAAIVIILESILDPSFGECDGELEVSASGGTGPYTYSIDGINFQVSTLFTGLCPGIYYIIAKDTEGNEGILEINLLESVNCSLYAGATIQDLINDGVLLGQLYNCTLGDLQ